MKSTLRVVLLSGGLILWDVQPDAAVSRGSHISDDQTQRFAREPNLSGIYLPLAEGGEECIRERRGVIVLPPLAVGATHISQTADFIVIRNQQVARVVPVRLSAHAVPSLKSYLGSPHGSWKDGTLVIESTGLRNDTVSAISALSPDAADAVHARIVERLTPIDPNILRYEFAIEGAYTRPLTMQRQLRRILSCVS
jgi:hypothetical protein